MPALRLGVVRFGSVQWVADTIRRRGLESRHGIAIAPVLLADTGAGRIALLAGGADVVVADWPFAAAQRAAGNTLCFAPFSAALGGIMVAAGAPIRGLPDLRGARLGVAGGPFDKSWLIVQAAAKAAGSDLPSITQIAYGAPPLLGAKLMQGELDAVLTFWPFAARLEATGAREAISVAACAAAIGLPPALPLVGYVFREEFARTDPARIDGFLAASAEAQRLLARDDAAWEALRPLMEAPDEALFLALRRRFRAGIVHPSAAEQQRAAAQVIEVLLRIGGPRALPGVAALPDGLFWDWTDAGA